ncbi:MAG: 1-acyl-sn-glycerol-3-phosphate acyltransferase [Lachnospiraceae bacterium]|nr:1-acyl-sn-glycerol-3-phosphate acyltransferase [Lachnospiraceae bacterium]
MLKKLNWAFEAVIVAFLYIGTWPVLRILYPRRIIWEDKKASQKVMKQPCVIYSNHTGYSDGLFTFDILRKYNPYTFIGKDWYEKNYFFHRLLMHRRYIPLDREQMDTSWLMKGKKVVDDGCSIFFFPEGHTSKDGLLLEFQPGFLMLAKQGNIPLVPICLDRKVDFFKPVRVIIGKPIYIDFSKEPGRPSIVLKKFANECRDSIIDLKDRYGNPKFVTKDVTDYRERKAAQNSDAANA